MREHDVFTRELFPQTLYSLQQRLIVRDKNLNAIAHLGQLGRRTDEIRNRSRITVPDKDVKPAVTQIFRDSASNDAEAEHPNVFPGSTRHLMPRFGFSRLFSLR